MTQEILISGTGETDHVKTLQASLVRQRPRVVGIASAFVSVSGVDKLHAILRKWGKPKCRLIAGTDNAITHPEALKIAKNHGWRVRLGRAPTGIFHVKLIIAGGGFNKSGGVADLCYVYAGSSNLTLGGFRRNTECGLAAEGDGSVSSASVAFADIWNKAIPATKSELRNYAARFAEHARRRSVTELSDLGVKDTEKGKIRPALSDDFAVAAWAGLQSFTGDYTFQVEFPKSAGKVIGQLIARRIKEDRRVDCYCPADETVRPMQYRFYADNSMFRLNIPNDVPGVSWARENRSGIALVEKGPQGGAPLRIQIIKPGIEEHEIVERSGSLGTWGRTPTRVYGWF